MDMKNKKIVIIISSIVVIIVACFAVYFFYTHPPQTECQAVLEEGTENTLKVVPGTCR